MSTVWESLADVLEAECTLYVQLLQTADNKRQAIVNNDLPQLDALTKQEVEWLQVVETYEEQRKNYAEEAACLVGLPSPAKMQALMQVAPPAITKRMGTTRESMIETLEALRHRNRQNTELLRICQDHATSFLQMLATAARPTTTYNRTGHTVKGSVALMDHRA